MTNTYYPLPNGNLGDTIDDNYWNLYLRDNMNAFWPYLNKGDIAIAQSVAPNVLTIIPKPSVTSVLTHNGSNYVYTPPKNLSGHLHTMGLTKWAHDQNFGGSWANITDGYVTLTLSVACTIFVFAAVTAYNALRYSARGTTNLRANINGVTDSLYIVNGGITGGRNEALPWIALATGVPSGSRTVQLQGAQGGESDNFTDGRLLVMAFAE